MEFLGFITEVLKTPALVLAIVALVGLALQRKSGAQIFSGTVKTALGMLILTAGAGLIVASILPFITLFQEVTGLDGFATGAELVSATMQSAVPVIASTSAVILAAGFLVNVLLARFTPLKYIFLTGHMLWISSVTVAYILYQAGFNEVMIMVVGSVLQGVLLTMLPAIAQPIVRKVVGGDDFALGHLTVLGIVPAAWVGGLLGNKSKNAEDMKLPKGLAFFKDTAVSIAVVMLFFYLIVVLMAGPDKVGELSGGTNYILFGLLQALGFAAGVLVLLHGVRLFLGELVPAFKGISDRLVPNAIPALDVPVMFAFGQNALMIGFVTAVGGMLVAMLASSLTFGVVPLVSIIGAFFTGGVAGIMGNATGGRRGAGIAGFLYGFALIFLSALTYRVFDRFSDVGSTGTGFDTIDSMITLLAFKVPWVGMVVVFLAFVALSLLEVRRQRRMKNQLLLQEEK